MFNTEKITKTLRGLRSSNIPFDFEDKDELIVLIHKYHMNGESRYAVKEFFSSKEDAKLEDDPRHYQVIVKGEINVTNKYKVNVENVRKVEESKVCKCREEVKEKLVQLFRICFPKKYIQGSKVVDLGREEPNLSNTPIRPIEKEDIKITTLWKDITAMSVRRASIGDDHIFKVGVSWRSWHSKSDTSLVKTLTHELVHFTHLHHRKSFYIEHARAVKSIVDSEEKREYVEENIIGGEINWNKVITLTMDGVHKQPDDIDTSGYQNRREACNSVVEELENIFDYDYSMGKTFYINPPYKKYSRMRSEWYNSEKEEIENIYLKDLNFEKNHSDREVYELMCERLKEEDEFSFRWIYSKGDIPVVDDDNNIVKNEWFAEMLLKMRSTTKSLEDDEQNIKLPIIREKNLSIVNN